MPTLERTATLHLLGRLAIRQECLRLLSNRLRIQEDLKRFPLIEQTPIRKPLVIVGLPRTGTTLLHHLLAQDPSARFPRMWELLQPSPSPRHDCRYAPRNGSVDCHPEWHRVAPLRL